MGASTGPGGKTLPYLSDLGYSADGGATYTNVSEIMLVHPPSPSREVAKVTVLDSPGFALEKLASWIDLGVVPFELYFTQAQYQTLLNLFLAGTTDYWRIRLPLIGAQVNHFTFVFQAFLSKFEFSEGKAEENDAYSCPGELTISSYTGYSIVLGS